MTAWTTIPDANLQPKKPVRSIDGLAFRDNPIAIAEGASGAPRIEAPALNSDVLFEIFRMTLSGIYLTEQYNTPADQYNGYPVAGQISTGSPISYLSRLTIAASTAVGVIDDVPVYIPPGAAYLYCVGRGQCNNALPAGSPDVELQSKLSNVGGGGSTYANSTGLTYGGGYEWKEWSHEITVGDGPKELGLNLYNPSGSNTVDAYLTDLIVLVRFN